MRDTRAMRICFLGDSFISGAFDPECLGWVGRIAAAARARGHDLSPYNLGIRGETSRQLAQRWYSEASPRQSPQQELRLVFEFGMNDVRDIGGKPQLQPEDSLNAAREILSRASRWKPTLMIGPPPVNDHPRNARVAASSAALAALCGELGVPYFDSHTSLGDAGVWLRDIAEVDGTHPSSAGYGTWARLIDEWPAWRNWVP